MIVTEAAHRVIGTMSDFPQQRVESSEIMA